MHLAEPFSAATLFVVTGALMTRAILSSRLSGRLGVPVFLVFLGIGMLDGSDGPGGFRSTTTGSLTAPEGSTALEIGDQVYLLFRPADRPFLQLLFSGTKRSRESTPQPWTPAGRMGARRLAAGELG